MSRFSTRKKFSHDAPTCTGVLITNLGTPDAPTAGAVRRYLGEFLSDPRVVELPRLLWWLILHGVILRIRPRKVAHAYASVWTDAGSPLLAIGQRQRDALQATLEKRFAGPVRVALGMRYGNPSLASALEQLREAGAQRLVVLPLYPQYSGSTNGSTFDGLAKAMAGWREVPDIRFISRYHDDPGYIGALETSIREYQQLHGRPQRLLFSFHGLPRRFLDQGDPYHCHCHKTARLVAEALGLADDEWIVTFQSRFGREEWLKPYTDHTLKALPGEGVRRVQVVCPGFSADCLETLEEISLQNRDFFLEAGGEQFDYIPALNDHPAHIEALTELVMREVGAWPEADPGWDEYQVTAALNAAQQRARALGADR